jgi:hypothetical protein
LITLVDIADVSTYIGFVPEPFELQVKRWNLDPETQRQYETLLEEDRQLAIIQETGGLLYHLNLSCSAYIIRIRPRAMELYNKLHENGVLSPKEMKELQKEEDYITAHEIYPGSAISKEMVIENDEELLDLIKQTPNAIERRRKEIREWVARSIQQLERFY